MKPRMTIPILVVGSESNLVHPGRMFRYMYGAITAEVQSGGNLCWAALCILLRVLGKICWFWWLQQMNFNNHCSWLASLRKPVNKGACRVNQKHQG